MKKITLLIMCLVLSGVIAAQTPFNCISHTRYEQQWQQSQQFRQAQEQLERETKDFMANSALKVAAPPYIIPVVFHVIYTTNAGNISDAQIVDQVRILNEEFNRLQPDTALTPPAFKSRAAAFDVEFRLATLDPSGNCTNGINRIYNTLSNCSFEEDDVKALSYWPSNKYLNVWVVQSMHYSSSMDCNGGGYATFPGGSPLLDGINIRGDLIGSIGTAASNVSWGNFKGRYLIHELGHWFNLRHIWGDQTCGNDLVADTPPAVSSNSGCPVFPRRPFSSCAGSDGDGEMFTNYMDYTNGSCLNMFTAGQVARMTACINSPTGGRSNLWTNANLNATGTNDPYTYPVACVAEPAITPFSPLVVCQGDSVRFSDNSYGGSPGPRTWAFPGGSPSSLTDSIVKVQYNTPGTYTVSLTRQFQATSKTRQFDNLVHVLSNTVTPGHTLPFREDFEIPADFDSDWLVINHDQDATTWERTQSTAYSGQGCVMVRNFGKSAPMSDDLISPVYDLSAVSNPTLTFRLHFANRITANYDRLTVSISNNCGKTWQQLYSRIASGSLNTVTGNISGSNTPDPGSDADWRQERVNIINAWASGKVRFKFSFTSGGGNNIFIDDINISGADITGLTAYETGEQIQIFPNPAGQEIQLRAVQAGSPAGEQRIEIIDVTGKICLVKTGLSPEQGALHLDISSIPAGLYFIKWEMGDGTVHHKKFIKQETK